MKTLSKYIFVALAFLFFQTPASAQDLRRYKIALFTPLYLDSAFDASGNERFGKNFPKFVNPGLDFYLGAQAALDSLQKKGAPLEVFVFDTKGRTPLSSHLISRDFSDVQLVIGHTNLQETRVIADAANRNNSIFVSTTLPNDAGITANPNFVVLNSALDTHIESIYRLLQKHYSKQNIIVFRRAGAQEGLLKKYLTDFSKSLGSSGVSLKFIDVPNEFSTSMLAAHLDSTRRNIVIAGSLDERFGTRLVQNLVALQKNYPTTVIGMPTWENVAFGKSANSLEIIYTTSFYYSRLGKLEKKITDDYTKKTATRPGDMYYRGFETMLRFALLLLDTDGDIKSNISRKGNYVFTQMDVQPVYKSKNSGEPDYFENKRVYFVRQLNGNKSLFQ